MGIPGTKGYAEQATELVARYEAIPFEHKYRSELALLPASPARVLDIGAGTGADAAWLAGRGYRVLAVEPTAALREAGKTLHASASIEWLDDHLPELAAVRARKLRFDLVLLTAVWMHLDHHERARGMRGVTELLGENALVLFALRHGPLPAGRRMFDVSADETIELARERDLICVSRIHAESLQAPNRAAGITWTRLAFRRA